MRVKMCLDLVLCLDLVYSEFFGMVCMLFNSEYFEFFFWF